MVKESKRLVYLVEQIKEGEFAVKLEINEVEETDKGAYKLIASNEKGEAVSQIVNLVDIPEEERKPTKPEIGRKLVDQKVTESKTFELIISLKQSDRKCKVEWYKGTTIVKETKDITTTFDGATARLTFSSAKMEHTSSYKVVVSNEVGKDESSCKITVEKLDEKKKKKEEEEQKKEAEEKRKVIVKRSKQEEEQEIEEKQKTLKVIEQKNEQAKKQVQVQVVQKQEEEVLVMQEESSATLSSSLLSVQQQQQQQTRKVSLSVSQQQERKVSISNQQVEQTTTVISQQEQNLQEKKLSISSKQQQERKLSVQQQQQQQAEVTFYDIPKLKPPPQRKTLETESKEPKVIFDVRLKPTTQNQWDEVGNN